MAKALRVLAEHTADAADAATVQHSLSPLERLPASALLWAAGDLRARLDTIQARLAAA